MAMLKTIFAADTSKLDRGLDRAKNKVGRFSKDVSRSLVAAFSVGAVSMFFRKMLTDLDRIGKLSTRGFSTDFIQDLGQEARLAGIDIEKVLPKISALFRDMNAGQKPTAAMTENLAALNLTIDDLKGSSPEEIFKKMITAMQNADDKAAALASTQALMKDRAGDMLPLFEALINNGIGEYAKASEDAVRSAEQFNDSMSLMGNTLMTSAGPAIVWLNKLLVYALASWKAISGFLIGGNMAIAQAFIGMAKAANAALHFDFSTAKKELEDMAKKVKLEMDAIGISYKQGMQDIQAFKDDMEKRMSPSILASVTSEGSVQTAQSATADKADKISKSIITDSMQRIGGGGRSVVATQRDESIRIANNQLSELKGIRSAIEQIEQEKMR